MRLFATEDTKQGIIRNLSAGGMAISSAFPAEAGNILRLNCTLPPNGQVKDLPAKVIRTSWEEGPGGQKNYIINLQFFDMAEEAKNVITDYVQKLVSSGAS